MGGDEHARRPLAQLEKGSELPVLLRQGSLGGHDVRQGVQLGMKAEGILGPELGLGHELLGQDEGAQHGRGEAVGYPELGLRRQKEDQHGQQKGPEGNGEIPPPSALVRRIGITDHTPSRSAWSRPGE